MSFLNPLALWGLAAMAVPILLLLFLQRRKLVIRWAAFEWMQQAIVTHRRKILITDILKLISKLLLLLALALMIGRPYLTSRGGGGRTLIIVDVSPSMGATLDNGTRLERAVAMADTFVSRYNGPVALYTFGGELEPLVPDFTEEKGLLRDRLRAIRLRHTYGGIDTLARQLPQQAAYGRAQRLVFFGDFQAAWFGDGPRVADELRRLGKGCPMTWVQVDDRPDPDNVAAAGLSLSPEGAFAGRSCFINATLMNGAASRTGDRTVTVTADDRPVSKFVTRFEAHEKRDFSIVAQFKEPGLHTVRVELDGDALPADNARYGVVNVPPPLRILAVVPFAGKDAFPADTWLKAAIKSLLPPDAVTYKTVSPIEFDGANLDDVDLLITIKTALAAGSPISQRVLSLLDRGGSVIAFLAGDSADEAAAFGVAGIAARAPGRVTKALLHDTYLDFMNDPQLKPEAITFTSGLLFSNVPPAEVRLRTEGGVLALKRQTKRGNLTLVGFIPAPGYTDFQFNPNFVQFLLRLLWESRGWSGFYADNGTLAEWRAAWINRDHAYSLQDPKGLSRALTIDGVGSTARLILPTDLDPGFYSILEDNVEKARFGHNADPGDSNLEPARAADLPAAIKEGLTFTTTADVAQILGRRELTPWVAIFLLLAIAFEAYAHFFRK